MSREQGVGKLGLGAVGALAAAALAALAVARGASATRVTGEECGVPLPKCCVLVNTTDSSETPLANCTCLQNNVVLVNQTVRAGEYRDFHWVLDDFQTMDIGYDRREIAFEVFPCVGNTQLYVRALRPPFPRADDWHYNGTREYEPNSVAVRVLRAQYFVSVEGGDQYFGAVATGGAMADSLALVDGIPVVDADQYGPGSESVFAIVARYADEEGLPAVGGGGELVVDNLFTDALVLDGDTLSMVVQFQTPISDVDFEYRVFTVANRSDSSGPCSSLGAPGACVTSTACGVLSSMQPASEWTSFPSDGRNVSVVVPNMEQEQQYFFSVVMREPGQEGNLMRYNVYTAQTGVPKYEKTSQLHSSQTVAIVAGSAGAFVFVLLILIFWGRQRLVQAFRNRRAKKAGASGVTTINPAKDVLQPGAGSAASTAKTASAADAARPTAAAAAAAAAAAPGAGALGSQ